MNRRMLKRGVGWMLVCREKASEHERNILGAAHDAAAIHRLVRERILQEQVEVMYAIGLDGRNRVIALCEVARGGLHGCSVYARDVLRPMVAAGATAFVLVHNHPSGCPDPSSEDVLMTRTVAAAAGVVGIPLVDHVVIAAWDRFASMYDLGLAGLDGDGQ